MKLYSERIRDLHSSFWTTPPAQLVLDKRAAKAWARDRCGLRVPADVPLPESFAIKPHDRHSAAGVTLMHGGTNVLGPHPLTVCEELIVDEDGSVPPRTFQCFVFGARVRMIQVYNPAIGLAGYYAPLSWAPLRQIDGRWPWLDCPPPRCLDELIAAAGKLASIFRQPIRVDLFASAQGPVFNEYCATPGLVEGGRITPEGDRLLGQWWQEWDDSCYGHFV